MLERSGVRALVGSKEPGQERLAHHRPRQVKEAPCGTAGAADCKMRELKAGVGDTGTVDGGVSHPT